jgi:hypothetical protein
LERIAELLDEMEREIGRLRSVSGSAGGADAAVWRETVHTSAAALARGVAGLLESLKVEARATTAANAEAHLRAKRFATVRVAEIQLYQAAQVKAGRSAGDLYGALKPVLDAARAAYAEQFLASPDARGVNGDVYGANGMPDYLHHEVVKALANNDAKLLGSKYPGPLV